MDGWLASFFSLQRSSPSSLSSSGPWLLLLPQRTAFFSTLLLSSSWIRSKNIFQHLHTPSLFPIPIPEVANWRLADVFCWDCWIFVFLIKWISYQHSKNWETSYNNLDFLLLLNKQGWLYLPALLSGASWGACALWFSMVLIRHTFIFIEIAWPPRHWNELTSYGKYTNSWGYHSPWPLL